MKKAVSISLIFVSVVINAQESDTFKNYFTEFRTAVTSADVATLKTLIYPFKDEVEDMQAELIQKIATGHELQKGDGAFSLKALDSLTVHHLEKIVPIQENLYVQLSKDPIFGKTIRTFLPEEIYVFEHKEAHVILFKSKEGVQLFFWENLNSLLR